MKPTRFVVTALLVFLMLAFVAQNTAPVNVHFLGWTFSVSGVVLLALTCGAGILIGLLIGRPWRRPKPKQEYAHVKTPDERR